MIVLTRLSGKEFVLNADLIKTVEETPDTTIKLVNGEAMIVRERMAEVIDAAIDYQRRLRTLLAPS
ncbi:MAG: flagellar FlbD family protein [Planctomycetota bacterium]